MILKKLVNILLNFVGRFDIIKLMLHSELKTLKPGTLLKVKRKTNNPELVVARKNDEEPVNLNNGIIVMFLEQKYITYVPILVAVVLFKEQKLFIRPRHLELV